MIATEVTEQLKPIGDMLHALKRKMDSLYRNGDTTIAPGYLDMRRQVDDDRYEEIKDFRKTTEDSLRDIQITLAEATGGRRINKIWIIVALALLAGIFTLVASDHFHWNVVTNSATHISETQDAGLGTR